MLQFYFLSIALNGLAGYLLFYGSKGDVLEFKCGFSLKDETFRFLVGILSMITGLFKILSPIEGDVPVIGDIVPAATGLLCGFVLVFEYYKTSSSQAAPDHAERIGKVLVAQKKLLGMAAFAAAALHFLFPRVLLL